MVRWAGFEGRESRKKEVLSACTITKKSATSGLKLAGRRTDRFEKSNSSR